MAVAAETRPGVSRVPDRLQRRLRITEIFLSLQGEARAAGRPSIFVRLTGCPLRCRYCDTEYAFHGGEWWSLDDVIAQVAEFGVTDVCVTGGEPLAQPACALLVEHLCANGYEVAVETGGALDISPIDRRASRILDIKTPGSGESGRNRWSNLNEITSHDQIKFVICDRHDYEWARDRVREHRLDRLCPVWVSPSYNEMSARTLGDWIVADRLPVRLQIQLHKQLWGDEPGR